MQQQERRIFVPTDFSKASNAALQYAIYIANRSNAIIDLVHFAKRDDLMQKSEGAAEYKKKLLALEKKLHDMKNKSGAAFRINEVVIVTM